MIEANMNSMKLEKQESKTINVDLLEGKEAINAIS